MIALPLFILAVAAVLVTPGPTNALLWTSAGLVGVRRSLPLMLPEIAGYLTTIGGMRLIGDPLIAVMPTFGLILRIALIGYLLLLSWQLWNVDPSPANLNTRVVTPGRVFLTTLLNPKALVFAFAIFPPFDGLAAAVPYTIAFVLTVGVVATGWIAFGAAVGRLGDSRMPRILPCIAAVILCLLAAVIAGSAITAVA